MMNDRRYLDTIMDQRHEHQRKKDDEKQKRVRAQFFCFVLVNCIDCGQLKTRAQTTMAEMMYGSKPATPVKRYFLLGTCVLY